MRIVLAGGSGFVGRALAQSLRASGHEVRSLVRRRAQRPDESPWNPRRGEIDRGFLVDADAVVNLAGENLAAGRWTAARRARIRDSRVEPTRTLVAAMQGIKRPPAVFLCASAVGIYGGSGDAVVTENSARGQGFLADVCAAWEERAAQAEALGVRTVRLRFGVVLAAHGGALARMLPLFRLGLGGRLGSGRQWMSWISLADTLGAIGLALEDTRCRGPVNVVSPVPVTNAEFARELARALHRPAVLPAPAWALRLVLGRGLADEALLASTRAEPGELRRLGYTFRHPALSAAFAAALGGTPEHALPR